MTDSGISTETYRAPAYADFNPGHSAPGGTSERLAHLEEHGYVIINDFVNSPWIPKLREAGRRVTEACRPEVGYDRIDSSRGYVHRTDNDEPWAIRGIMHPAFGVPAFPEFHGSDEFVGFCASWCGDFNREDLVMGHSLLWSNPRYKDNALGWHRDLSWWGTGKRKPSQRDDRATNVEEYTEEVELKRWEEIRADNKRALEERNGVSMFLALVDEECHELIPGSHNRWRTTLEHDVLLPKKMKEAGIAHTPSWNGEDPLPGQTAIRLRAGEALIRNGATIHTGHNVSVRERNTLSIGWSKWKGPSDEEPKVEDARMAWQLDPAVREALPHEWMKTAYDRWAVTRKLGDSLEDRYTPWDIRQIKSGKVVGWRGELEKQAAKAGESWEKFQTVE
jgi:ectoine hydroxylase-related dioxygenase (phytanoyl-CoA dioxygenase family)